MESRIPTPRKGIYISPKKQDLFMNSKTCLPHHPSLKRSSLLFRAVRIRWNWVSSNHVGRIGNDDIKLSFFCQSNLSLNGFELEVSASSYWRTIGKRTTSDRGGRHSIAVAFVLTTQPAWVQFSVMAFPRKFSWCRCESTRQPHCLECGQC